MPEKVVPGPVCEDRSIREAVCIHTKKIFDSCREEDIAFYILFYKIKVSWEQGQNPGKMWWVLSFFLYDRGQFESQSGEAHSFEPRPRWSSDPAHI